MTRAIHASLVAAVGLLAGLVAAVLVVAPAAAHTELIESTPADGATVTALPLVSLEFSGTVLDVGTEIFVTDSTGVTIPLEVTQPGPTVVEATVPGLANGAVAIEWRVVAEDGHPVEGVLAVVLDAPAPSPAPSPDPSPTSATPTADPTPASATPDAVASPISAPVEEGGLPPWMWALIGLAIVGSGVAVFIAAAQRGSGKDWDEPMPPDDQLPPADD